MIHDSEITLQLAQPEDLSLLANLLELYTHDLSAIFPHVTLNATGRFGYATLPLYFSEPSRRLAFLIHSGARIAGFVMVTRGIVSAANTDALDVAEFFVLRQFRRSRVGRTAALQLWERMPGRWTVRVSVRNTGALQFWSDTLAEFSATCTSSVARSDADPDWHVFSFVAGER